MVHVKNNKNSSKDDKNIFYLKLLYAVKYLLLHYKPPNLALC